MTLLDTYISDMQFMLKFAAAFTSLMLAAVGLIGIVFGGVKVMTSEIAWAEKWKVNFYLKLVIVLNMLIVTFLIWLSCICVYMRFVKHVHNQWPWSL